MALPRLYSMILSEGERVRGEKSIILISGSLSQQFYHCPLIKAALIVWMREDKCVRRQTEAGAASLRDTHTAAVLSVRSD